MLSQQFEVQCDEGVWNLYLDYADVFGAAVVEFPRLSWVALAHGRLVAPCAFEEASNAYFDAMDATPF